MTIHVSTFLEDALRRLAGSRGQDVDALVEEAIRQYLDAAAVTDVAPSEIASTQAALMGELGKVSGWPAWQEPDSR